MPLLKLKRVELQGFKSFCDRTEMRFHGAGIAAVVGPNGCGKSNLSDAISWVLGEQSAKSLRGSRMEDVIFAGTRDRKPVGMAAVTLTMVDPANHDENGLLASIPTNGVTNGVTNGAATNGHATNGHATNGASQGHDITITRRLFRSGESEYLIDGKLARLRDIQDLFMGTGLGPESYAIIEQGRIGQILSSRPQDRRSVIEEAAGVSKFKTRRRLAEAKLESARQNLSRVFDILEEVGRQANSLKRQAAKARRFKELHEEMVAALRQTLAGRYRILERDAAKVALDLNLANADHQALTAQLSEKEQQQQRCQEECFTREAELTRLRQALADQRLDAERTRGRLEAQARQIAAIEQRLTQGETDTDELERLCQELQSEIEKLTSSLAELDQQGEQARQRLAAKTQERDQAAESARRQEIEIDQTRQRVLRLLGESSALKNQLAQIDEYLAALERDQARSRKEEESSAADTERLTGQRQEMSAKLAARQLELESTADRRRRVEEDLNARKAQEAELRRKVDELRGDASRLKARKDSLEEILSHRAYTTESVKRLFTAIEQGQAEGLHAQGVLADFVDVEASWEKAAESFLHDELEYVVVSDWPQAERGIDLMRTELEGRATFLIHPENGAGAARAFAEPPLGPETGIIARLSDMLKMTNGLRSAPADMIPRLSRCFLAESRGAAHRLAMQYPEYYFLVADGVCYHGHAVSGGRKAGGGPLALKRELRELTVSVAARHRELAAASESLERLEREAQGLALELEHLRTEQQSQEKETLALDHEMRRLAEELARTGSRLSLARLELQRLEGERARAVAQRESNLADVEQKEGERRAQEDGIEQARIQLNELQARGVQLAEEHSALRVALAESEERRRSEKAAQGRIETQHIDLLRRRRELGEEMERLGVERARLLSDNIELDARAGELAAAIEKQEGGVQQLEQADARGREELAASEETLRQMRLQAQESQERRAQIEVALAERRAELRYLDETCRKELNAPLEEIAAAVEAPDEMALAETEQCYNELKTKIDNLGPVNTQALEEYQEAQQRYDFLNAQRQDLLDSIRDTEKAIQEIDVESRRRFNDAFTAINVYFREIFQRLFAGGAGEMRLTDEANIGDCGIDIVASPPGKRLQNVLLLSGGEKALTALALLMAIFRYQPSPFCILDEVDAPLDEPNIERLMRLLRDMSHQSQFIIITHAKRTMEVAESLYGVTMQEPGVSKLVSVRFRPAVGEAEPVAATAAATAVATA